jgi:hypothetical protein
MKLTRPITAITQKLYYTGNLIQQFTTLVSSRDQTYFPESAQKSKWSIFRDHLLWVIKNREINRFYYVYGLDRKHQRKSQDVIAYRHFRQLRNRANLQPEGLNFNYACLMRDKFVFGQFMKSLGIPTPKNIALLDTSGVSWLDNMKNSSYTTLLQQLDKPIDGFCKKLRGIRGEGAFPLSFINGKIYSGDNELSVDELKQKVEGTYLLQERLTQHPEMARLHPESINTIRLVTFNNQGNIELFFSAIRVGTNKRNVDNWNAGGIAIAVDMSTGKLRQHGIQKSCFGKRADTHPDTGITFLDYQIPFFKESVELVCTVHRYLYSLHSIGWDVAITENGPILIEANEDWDGSFAMCSEDNFKEKFLNMFEK